MGTSVSPCQVVERFTANYVFALGIARQGLTLVHFAAQPEPILTQNTP
jgi:hypothetical protein